MTGLDKSMAGLDKLSRFNGRLCEVFELVGIVAFLFMMFLTTVDVVGAKVFLAPVPGSLDLMMVGQLICLSFAFAASYYASRHVEVEFFIPLLPSLIQRITALMVDLLLLALMIAITWQLFVYGTDLKDYHEVSPTIRIQLYPFTYGAAVAFIPACLVALTRFARSVIRLVKP